MRMPIDWRRVASRAVAALGYRFYGLDVFGKKKWVDETMHWSSEQRATWRLAKLADIIDFAWNEVPFYREFWGDHGLQPRRLQHIDELEAFPILRKEIFRANADRIEPRLVDRIRHIRKHTGGSTSVPVHYLLDLEQWTLIEAFHLWGWAGAGYDFGDPVGVIAGGSLVPENITWKSRARTFALRRIFLFGVAMDREMARRYHAALSRHGAKFLYGYPSILYLFAKHVSDLGLPSLDLRAAVTTAEMLLPQYRQGIEKWLGCPVFNNLGSNDGGFESYECRLHRGFHYNDLQAVLEVEAPASTGQESRLLITNLWNRSTPFIRYENGDLVRLSLDACPCGAPFPLIASIQGRTADVLSFGNGRSLSGPALTLIFGDMEIDGWQIVQTGALSLEVRLQTSREVPKAYEQRIRRVVDHHLNSNGREVDINVLRVDRLETTMAGKLKPIWRQGAP